MNHYFYKTKIEPLILSSLTSSDIKNRFSSVNVQTVILSTILKISSLLPKQELSSAALSLFSLFKLFLSFSGRFLLIWMLKENVCQV